MTYTDDVKGAVMAALLAGQSVCSVSKEYNLPKGTVSAWRTRYCEPGVAEGSQNFATQKSVIGEKLIALISAQLDSALERVKLFGDRDWLERQNAAELGTLHGIDIDKAVRLLEAFAAGQSEADD